MSYGILKTLKKENTQEITKKYVQHVVVGRDVFAVASYIHLKEKFGADKVLWINDKPVSVQDLQSACPSQVRGEANITALKQLLPELSLEVSKSSPVYFKEGKYRTFKGRGKPEALLWGEEFYTQDAVYFNRQDVFSFLAQEEFLATVIKEQEIKMVLKVESHKPTDLAEPNHWTVQCADGEHISCENLVWCQSPAKLSKLAHNRTLWDGNILAFCEQGKGQAVLRIDLSAPDEIAENETFFIPLSYTHEWGHFIGERKGNTLSFIHFLDPLDTSEDEISKKIRLLQRSLEKIYSDHKWDERKEFISLEDYSPCLNFDDSLVLRNRNLTSNLLMPSTNGMIGDFEIVDNDKKYPSNELSHFVRGLISLKNLTENL